MPLRQVAAIMQAGLETQYHGTLFNTICTDSRAVAPGQFFLALRGEKFDGHRYAELAVQRGAGGLIVERDWAAPAALAGLPILRVEDTLRAYGDLAAARRREWGGPVLAISGSVGKTTARRLVADTLRHHRRVLEPIRNFNNLIGVPYTLLGLEAVHEIAVLELGMNLPGELRRLTEIAHPSAALLTMIGLTHIGMFAREQDLIDAKLDLFRGCEPGVPLAVNADCARTRSGLAEFRERHPLVFFCGDCGDAPLPHGVHEPEIWVENVRPLTGEATGYQFDLILPGGRLPNLELRMFGRHHLQNVAAAAALLHAAGLPGEWVAGALDGFRSEPLRGEIVQSKGRTLILDCYNASPPSMQGALASLAELPAAGRRVLVLADMLELGDAAPAAHEALLTPLRRLAPALFFGLGPHSARLAETLRGEGWEASGFTDRAALITALEQSLQPGDQVFFKGSHGFGLEHAAQAIAPDLSILPGGGHE